MAAFLAFVAAVLAAIALVRVRDLRARLLRIEDALRDRKPARGWPPEPVAPLEPVAPAPIAPAPMEPPPPPRIPVAGTPRAPQAVPQPAASFDWERWLGVRGAAVLGGVFLAVAGILFFQYSIEHGLLTKEWRVALGALAGVGCLVGGEVVRRRGYALTGNAITGAGAVILYAAFWSAHALGIFPFGVSFALMVGVTALCCFLSWRNDSQVVAWLGLSGGFATPILLSTGRDEPIALFSYMMLLDASFLFVARGRRWPLVGALGLLGTFLVQGAWFFTRMGPHTFAIGIVSLGMFAILFAVLAPKLAPSEGASGSARTRWIAVRVGALLLPFAFAAQFAGRVDVGYHLYPLVLLASLLAAASSVLARRQEAPHVPVGAAAGASTIALVWVLSNQLETARVWELVLCAIFACGVLHFFCEWGRSRIPASLKEHDTASAVGAGGMVAVLVVAAFRAGGGDVWPLVAGFVALPLFLLRLDAFSPRTVRPFLACVPACLGISVWLDHSGGGESSGQRLESLAAVLVAPVVFLAVAALRRESRARKACFAAAAVACVPLFPALEFLFGQRTHPAVALLPVLALGVCMLLGASGARSGLLLGLAALATSFVQWVLEANIRPIDPAAARIGAAVLVASSSVFLLWPLARRSIWTESRTIAWTSPFTALLWFPATIELWRAAREGSKHTIPAIAFALMLLVGAGWAFYDRRDEIAAERSATRSSIAKLGLHALALAAPFLAVAIAASLGRSPWPQAMAAFCLGCAFLWRRSDHPPLKYACVGAALLSTVLLLNEALAQPLQRFPIPLLSGLGFDFFLPAVAALAAALLGHAREVARLRPAEKGFYSPAAPLLFALVGIAGLGSLLVWITVEVERLFATEYWFRVRFGDLPARDLSLSIAWALFALLLLVCGTKRSLGALRWVSLVLLVATIGKVFLLDLEDLRGLYRVGSFLGLAVSLLIVSLLYQRFVFRRVGAERT